VPPGFKRCELEARYNVPTIAEDEWHAYTGDQTQNILAGQLATRQHRQAWVLNAGAGVYNLRLGGPREVSVDLFRAPIRCHALAVCATVEHLPFRADAFDAIVCVGEVLAYCDPAAAIREFARVAGPTCILVCDFASSRSARHWLKRPYGRAADLVTDLYNGSPENTWIYHPEYIKTLLHSSGFVVSKVVGTHTLSALARRMGATTSFALRLQRFCEWLPWPCNWADIMTIVAVRSAS